MYSLTNQQQQQLKLQNESMKIWNQKKTILNSTKKK